jgi:hypothetical protein
MLTEKLLEDTVKKVQENNKLEESDKNILVDTYREELEIIRKIKVNLFRTNNMEEKIRNSGIYIMEQEKYNEMVSNNNKYLRIQQIVDGE